MPNLKICRECIFRAVCGGGCRGNALSMAKSLDMPDPINCIIVKKTFPLYTLVTTHPELLKEGHVEDLMTNVEVVEKWIDDL